MEKRIADAVIAPDGLALDASGAVWVADCIHNRAARIAEGGEILEEVKTPDGCLRGRAGWPDRAQPVPVPGPPDFDETARTAAREALVAATEVSVPHAGTP